MECYFMPRYLRFTFLCNLEERQAIADLATYLQRSQSDSVRFVILETAKMFANVNLNSVQPMSKQAQESISEENDTATN
jgi:hypothetical protein